MTPTLFDMALENSIMSPQGQSMTPGFTEIENAKISLGVVYMPPGNIDPPAGIANAHVHLETDIIVSLLEAGPEGAITLWGNQLQNVIVQYMGQHLYMPAGTPHVAINPSKTHHIRACEYRSNGVLMTDNVVLSELQSIAMQFLITLLTD